ncbi:hypothetical protein [Williamsia sp. CHRR-6]|uniref:aa3-type cytochrome oxidase subunit CtaJ n=1 Tax=Williamsia sp. CHRR-6 TaxID=2835871 RepID=UPI001BDB1E0A|nr:hypothetical protein [Williamsia sp. CHRR-6]MBT0568295.1 hypothetical protein [Williamsia sp. CHRR-6]
MEDWIVWIGFPIVVLCGISVLACIVSMAYAFGVKHAKSENYTLDQEWKRPPLLLSATEVSPVAPPAHHAGHDDLIGGSASGKW